MDTGTAGHLRPPIRKLPPELLSLIFQLAVDTNVILGRLGARTFGAVSLSTVCSHWRTVILETPPLWATLSLYLPPRDRIPDLATRAREYLETAIERAQDVLLSVTIEFHQFSPAWESLIDILISRPWQSALIRHFEPGEGFSSIQNSKILPHLQFVRNLEFDVGRRVGESYHPLFHPNSTFHTFQSFPNLRTLLLPHQNPHFSKIPIAYQHRIFHPHLTHLRICAGNDYIDTLGALGGCATSLVSLSISIFPTIQGPRYQRERERERETEVVRFQVLRDLVVVVTESSHSPYDSHPLTSVHKVLSSVECPSLLSLTLQSFIEHASYNNLTRFDKLGLGFRDFIVRSEVSMQLEAFTFRGFGISDDQVLEMLDCVPGIRELTVVELNTYYVEEDAFKIFTTRFFDRFRVVEGSSVFLPRLKVFRILLFRDLGKEFGEVVENRSGLTRMCSFDGID